MDLPRDLLSRALAAADVRFDGGRPWDPVVTDPRLYAKVLRQGNLGLGEAYMDGWWECDDLEGLFRRVLASDLEAQFLKVPTAVRVRLESLLLNQQTRTRARRVAEQHYDLGNDLFTTFLGRFRNYSCGYYDGVDTLDEAQQRKMELICRKLDLQPGDRLLDVGGGWGELARHAAETRGCHVTSINISDEQIAWAREHTRGLPVEVVKRDYREIDGTFDKIASIAMLTHVGPRNYRSFMQIMRRALRPGGAMIVECVGGNVTKSHCDPWVDRYIFPGGVIPSLGQVGPAIEGIFVLEDLHNFGPDYARTLRAWNENLHAGWPALSARYPERVLRMFRYFFLSVAATFAVRQLQQWQFVLTPTGAPPPPAMRS